MGTYNVGIGKNDIQEAVLLPEDWYVMEIVKDSKDKNRAWKDAGEHLPILEAGRINKKAGENIVLKLKVISDIPEFNNRRLTKYLPLPNDLDTGEFTGRGIPKADDKAEVIYAWVEAFCGLVEGSEASFSPGQKALVYILQGQDLEGKPTNEISMNIYPKQLGAGSGLNEGSGLDPLGL